MGAAAWEWKEKDRISSSWVARGSSKWDFYPIFHRVERRCYLKALFQVIKCEFFFRICGEKSQRRMKTWKKFKKNARSKLFFLRQSSPVVEINKHETDLPLGSLSSSCPEGATVGSIECSEFQLSLFSFYFLCFCCLHRMTDKTDTTILVEEIDRFSGSNFIYQNRDERGSFHPKGQ